MQSEQISENVKKEKECFLVGMASVYKFSMPSCHL